MKHSLTLLLLALTVFPSFAQEPDKTLARVRYTFTHIVDTNQKDKPRVENMLLAIGKNASVYTSYDKLNQSLNVSKMLAEQMKNQTGSNDLKFDLTSSAKGTVNKTSLTQFDYYFFARERKFITRERLFNTYLVEEDAATIDWKVLKDTMSFSGIYCQKATANFKGRNWIAWFATALPFQSGPWKLNSLPGLIIEAYDDKKEVKFEFAGLENVTPLNASVDDPQSGVEVNGANVKVVGLDVSTAYLGPSISLPADGIKTSRKDLDKLKAARDKDPLGFMQAQTAGSGIYGSIKIQSLTKAPGAAAKNLINNPIELPEKK
jgi:GLPGLI family protein